MTEKPFIIWDWNGTLLDDVSACIGAMNVMLKKRDLALLDTEHYRNVFTFPVIDYYRTIGFDFDREPFSVLAEEYIALYQATAHNAPLRPGAEETLRRLAASGCRQIVLSATETGSLERQVTIRGVHDYFEELLGADNIHAHGKIDIGREYIRIRPELDLTAAVLIGDTFHDYEVSRALGCRCILLKNGHQNLKRFPFSAATLVVDKLDGLLPLVATEINR